MMRMKRDVFQDYTIYIRDLDFLGEGLPKTFKKIYCPGCGHFHSLKNILNFNTKMKPSSETLKFIAFVIALIAFWHVVYMML